MHVKKLGESEIGSGLQRNDQKLRRELEEKGVLNDTQFGCREGRED